MASTLSSVIRTEAVLDKTCIPANKLPVFQRIEKQGMTHGITIKQDERRDETANQGKQKLASSQSSITKEHKTESKSMSGCKGSDKDKSKYQNSSGTKSSESKSEKTKDLEHNKTKDDLSSNDENLTATKPRENEAAIVPTQVDSVTSLINSNADIDKESSPVTVNVSTHTLGNPKQAPISVFEEEAKADLSALVNKSTTCANDPDVHKSLYSEKTHEQDVKQINLKDKNDKTSEGKDHPHTEQDCTVQHGIANENPVPITYFDSLDPPQTGNGARPKVPTPSKNIKSDDELFPNYGLQPIIPPNMNTEKVESTETKGTSSNEVSTASATSSSKRETIPMTVAVPTKEQLANAFGGGLGNLRAEREGEDIFKIDGIFIQKCKVLGQGPNSVVFEGRLESPNGIPIAVKRITCKDKPMAVRTQKEMDDLWDKLYREVELLRGVEQWRHPNIVGYYCSKTVINELYIAFQLCQGDLEDYVSEEYKFWREHINPRQINQHMAEGVRFLHANSIVHRDLKPKNVFLVWKQGHCTAVIGDLGMSKATVKGMFSLSLSVGSIGYLAPEVWEEASKVVRFNNKERPQIEDKSDIFPLGLLFFFTTTNGKNPFGDELLGNQLRIAAGRPPAFNHNRPEDYVLEVLLRKMFSRNPKARPTAEEVCAHPGLWENDEILKFFSDSSDMIESMYKEGKAVDHIVANNILPHGNWMRDLPEALRHYLKRYRVHGKLLYQGKESSTRYLLRAIRNIAAHFRELPDDVKDEFKVHQAEFWMAKYPLLLPNLYSNIELSKVSAPTVKRYVVAIPSIRPTSGENSSSKTIDKKHHTNILGNKDRIKSGDRSTKRSIVRRRKSKTISGASLSNIEVIKLPVHWKPMPADEPIRMVELLDSSQEYQNIASQFINEATSGPYSHKMEFDLTKLRVTKVEKVQNRRLYQQFSVRRDQIEEEKETDGENGPLCRRLWHGTTADSVPSIIHNGFNRGYSGKNGTWYGEGVYFALSASYAARSWITQCIPGKREEGHIFLADVVVGCYCRGHYGMRYLPPIDPDEPTVMYDSAADNPDNPMEFVIFHDSQAYPSYLVTFTSS